jgi:hypothetical protein
LNKSIACFLYSLIGDALGSHTEFSNFNPENELLVQGWEDLQKKKLKRKNI